MKRIVVQKELNYQVDKNNALVRSSMRIYFVRVTMNMLFVAIARALIRNPKILLLDEGEIKVFDVVNILLCCVIV
jgi:ABC-type Na+ transport system ATPase subunit NatA